MSRLIRPTIDFLRAACGVEVQSHDLNKDIKKHTHTTAVHTSDPNKRTFSTNVLFGVSKLEQKTLLDMAKADDEVELFMCCAHCSTLQPSVASSSVLALLVAPASANDKAPPRLNGETAKFFSLNGCLRNTSIPKEQAFSLALEKATKSNSKTLIP